MFIIWFFLAWYKLHENKSLVSCPLTLLQGLRVPNTWEILNGVCWINEGMKSHQPCEGFLDNCCLLWMFSCSEYSLHLSALPHHQDFLLEGPPCSWSYSTTEPLAAYCTKLIQTAQACLWLLHTPVCWVPSRYYKLPTGEAYVSGQGREEEEKVAERMITKWAFKILSCEKCGLNSQPKVSSHINRKQLM